MLAAVWGTVLLFPFTTQRTLRLLTHDGQERLVAVPVCAVDCPHNFLEALRPLCNVDTGNFPEGIKLTSYDRLRPRLKLRGATSPLPCMISLFVS